MLLLNKKALFEYVNSTLGNTFFRSIAQLIVDSYNFSHIEVFKKFSLEEGKDLLPHYRRAKIEEGLRDITSNYSNLNLIPMPNSSNNCSHNEIHVENLIITVSWIKEKGQVVRPAKFRNDLAKFNDQYSFDFADNDNSIMNVVNDNIYAIVTHGSQESIPQYPDYINLSFPSSENQNKWLVEFDLLNNLITPTIDIIENIEDVSIPVFKQDISKTKGNI
ncbi:MAG: hypothetical protein WAR79_14015 [Melioribacteraceae bacterium]